MNIDDTKLQLYVDGELDQKESLEVENFIKNNISARKKVEEYRKISNLLFEKYKSIDEEDLPQKTINLLMQEDKSFIKKLFNYEIKLMNALASAAAILLIAVMVNYNFENTSNKDLNNLEAQNKNSILNELKNIIGDEEVSTLTSSVLNKTVKYEVVKEFVNNSNEKCSEIRFYEFKIKNLNIDEAIFCGNKVIKLKFYKGDLKQI